MARVPDFKRISKEDFPSEYLNLIERLAFPLNSHIEQVRNALNGNINFDNLEQEKRVLSFTTNESGQPIVPLSFRSNIGKNVEGISVVRVVITSNNQQFATQMPVFSWSQNIENVNVTSIGGLEPETGYQITIITI